VADHPVKVPENLVSQWWEEAVEARSEYWPAYVADRAAQWGADQELEACCEWLRSKDILEPAIDALRATRRPKPPTLAEQGLKALRSTPWREQRHYDAMFAALTRLAELEAQQ
jgi:hypothetical protein